MVCLTLCSFLLNLYLDIYTAFLSLSLRTYVTQLCINFKSRYSDFLIFIGTSVGYARYAYLSFFPSYLIDPSLLILNFFRYIRHYEIVGKHYIGLNQLRPILFQY